MAVCLTRVTLNTLCVYSENKNVTNCIKINSPMISKGRRGAHDGSNEALHFVVLNHGAVSGIHRTNGTDWRGSFLYVRGQPRLRYVRTYAVSLGEDTAGRGRGSFGGFPSAAFLRLLRGELAEKPQMEHSQRESPKRSLLFILWQRLSLSLLLDRQRRRKKGLCFYLYLARTQTLYTISLR